MSKQAQDIPIPSIEELRREIERVNHKNRRARTFRSTIYILITVAAAGVLIASLFLPVLIIRGGSMAPTLKDGTVVVAFRYGEIRNGDIIAFHYNNKILTKRVIASPGSLVTISDDGTVYLDGAATDEPYVSEKALGDCDLVFPYRVPDGSYFVMGDHRRTSVDSRNSALGCAAKERTVGRLIFKIWPLNEIGVIK